MKRKIKKRKRKEVLLTLMRLRRAVTIKKLTTKCNWRRNIASLSTN